MKFCIVILICTLCSFAQVAPNQLRQAESAVSSSNSVIMGITLGPPTLFFSIEIGEGVKLVPGSSPSSLRLVVDSPKVYPYLTVQPQPEDLWKIVLPSTLPASTDLSQKVVMIFRNGILQWMGKDWKWHGTLTNVVIPMPSVKNWEAADWVQALVM